MSTKGYEKINFILSDCALKTQNFGELSQVSIELRLSCANTKRVVIIIESSCFTWPK